MYDLHVIKCRVGRVDVQAIQYCVCYIGYVYVSDLVDLPWDP